MLISVRYAGNTLICTAQGTEDANAFLNFDDAVEKLTHHASEFRGRVTINPRYIMSPQETNRGVTMQLSKIPFTRLNLLFDEISIIELPADVQAGVIDSIQRAESKLVLP